MQTPAETRRATWLAPRIESLPKMLIHKARSPISTTRGIKEISFGENLPFILYTLTAAKIAKMVYLCQNLRFMNAIHTQQAPAAIGPYSQAIDSGLGLVFVSGQLPIDPATGAFPEGGVAEQTRRSLLNAKAILAQAGLTLGNVVKTTVFLADMNDFAEMNGVYATFFEAPYPTRSAVAVKTLPKGALVEIECIASRG